MPLVRESVSNTAATMLTPPASRVQSTPVKHLQPDLPFTGVSFGVGIRWEAPVDLDLWVRPRPGAKELSYRTRTTDDGKYFHDFHKGGGGVLDYEYCEIASDVDPKQIECWINWYNGSAPSVSGVVAIYYRGQTFHRPFTVRASKGNRGRDARDRASSSQWLKINVAEAIGPAVKSDHVSLPKATP
jgi:hypothetical protein